MKILFIERTEEGRRLFVNLSLQEEGLGNEVFFSSAPLPEMVIQPDVVVIEGRKGSFWAEGIKLFAEAIYPTTTVAFLTEEGQLLHDHSEKLLAIYEKSSGGKRLLNLKATKGIKLKDNSGNLNFEVIYEYKPAVKSEAA